MRRYKNWAHKISSWKYLTIWGDPAPPQPAQSASCLLFTLNSFQGMLKISSLSSTWFNPWRGRWQAPMEVPICSWQSYWALPHSWYQFLLFEATQCRGINQTYSLCSKRMFIVLAGGQSWASTSSVWEGRRWWCKYVWSWEVQTIGPWLVNLGWLSSQM